MTRRHWVDRISGTIAPRWTLKRERARLASEFMLRHYEAAGTGRRTQGWRRSTTDANRAIGPFAGRLRDAARDLVRNNPYAESALTTIVNHTVGWGIVAKPSTSATRALRVWQDWAGTTDCDADGRHDFAGLQKVVMRTVVESGECLVRRRFRRPEDGFALPLQLQILEPDFLDTSKDLLTTFGGGRIVQGVEFNAIGQRVAYWLFPEHPGSGLPSSLTSQRVSAQNILHIFKADRPGQVRGVSWFAPVLLRFKDFDELEDATLMKQKIAACLSVLTTDVDGTAPAIGATDTTQDPQIDSLEPGMILNLPPGRSVEVVQPPSVREYSDYAPTILKAIAAGLHVTYEDLASDYADLPFSAARMSRNEHWSYVEDWRWHLLIPQFCDPAWAWAMEVAAVFGTELPEATWTAPPPAMIDPVNEGLAYQRNIRTGIMSLSEALRERGYDPQTVLREIASDNALLDELRLVVDCDPRKMTQAGQLQGDAAQGAAPQPDQMAEAARVLRLASGERR